MSDSINSPSHYTQASAVIEPIDVLRHAPFDLGNALKYVIRAGHKGDAVIDLMKARKYLEWSMETYRHSSRPYDLFLAEHGLYLTKIERLQLTNPEDGFWSFVEELKRLINSELRQVDQEHHGRG